MLLDVREPDEIERGKIEGALEVDNELGQQIVSSWPRDREIIVYCEHGGKEPKGNTVLKTAGI